jgi:glutamyl-tRNA(Gln) amidotransferase subunit D
LKTILSSGTYKGESAALLSKYGISPGDIITIETSEQQMTGVLMPRYESASDRYIVIKLKSGYNTGIEVSRIKSIKKLVATTASSPRGEIPEESRIQSSDLSNQAKTLPKIALISTGGTIASRIDYRTGGVRAALSAAELYSSVPELSAIASVDPEVLMSEYSENLKPEHWDAIASRVAEKVRMDKYDGIIVSHGTDTMHYTASALSFALQDLSIPVVLVGSQRSSDRPSSDAALNLVGAAIFAAKAPVSGVFVAMHAGTSDDIVAIHVGTRVRKNHTSRRDAFESIDVTPVALVRNGTVEMQNSGIRLMQRGRRSLMAKTKFDSKVILLKYYPGFDTAVIDYAVSMGYKAIILEGTGLGHVNRDCFASLKNAVEKGTRVCMTSQCIWGRVRMTVYDTGRDLLDIGVIPLSDMISECAISKAMWVLANSDSSTSNFRKVMQENLANETSYSIPVH